ncbi:MAG: RNB domain-containing ribonuclease [Deltaproteobacteria bacterium]|nr:RNB domain-containing ribonuclease [Deltaproteobacteria bacterium]
MIQRGLVVEFIEDDKFVAAVCLDLKNDKPRLLTQFGREMVLPVRRLVNTQGPILPEGLSRDEISARLKELAARRENLSKEADLPELWSLLLDEDVDDALSPDFLAGLVFGEPIEADHVSALIRAVLQDKIYFKYRPEGLTVSSAERVEQLLTQRQREAELKQEKEEAGTWLAAVWAGQEAQPPAQAEEIISHLIDAAVCGQDSTQAGRVKGYLQAAGIRGAKAAFKLLVKLGRFGPDEDLDLRRLKIPVNFPEAVKAEAEQMARAGIGSRTPDDRLDLTDLDVFTLDGPSTRDFDDALSVELASDRLTVYIHITDPSPFLHPGSVLDQEARARAASVYLPDQRLPMLPDVLSEDLLSLKEAQLRPALSLKVELSRQGQVLSHHLSRSLIKVSRRLIYQEVDKNLAQDPQLAELAALAQKLKERRAENGALILEVPEVMVWPGQDRIEMERVERPTLARLLVAEMMILGNRLVAQSLAQAGLSAPFRTQEPPKTVFEPPPGADPLWVTLKQRMNFTRLEICPGPGVHSGLGLPAYTTFTSPIRRYLDLVTIRQLHALLDGRPPPYDHASLEEIIVALAPTLRAHNQLKFRRQRYWLLRYLTQDPDRPLEALVLDRLHDKFSLVLLEPMLRVASPKLPQTALTPGQRVTVRITKIDPQDDIIRVELV